MFNLTDYLIFTLVAIITALSSNFIYVRFGIWLSLMYTAGVFLLPLAIVFVVNWIRSRR